MASAPLSVSRMDAMADTVREASREALNATDDEVDHAKEAADAALEAEAVVDTAPVNDEFEITAQVGSIQEIQQQIIENERALNPAPESTKSFSEKLDDVQTVLDVAGFTPVVGAIPDLVNTGIHAARGNIGEAALSAAAMIPGAGDAVDAVADANKAEKVGDVAVSRTGPKGVNPDHHNANVMVKDKDGKVTSHERLVSGNMTTTEKDLGFPKGMLASHTKARAVTKTDLKPGERPPCPSCKGYMNRASTDSGASVNYQWRENGQTRTWSANNK